MGVTSRETAAGSRTLARGLAVLRALARSPEGATVASLASTTALDRAVLYRLLDTLADDGFVFRDTDSRRYHLGVALVELGARAARGLEVRRLSLAGMRALMEQCKEVICLAVRDRSDVVVVDRVEPPGLFVRVGYHIGYRHPLSVGAHGRALLAHLPVPDQQAFLGREPALLGALEACRRHGYAVSCDELERGAVGVAAAVVDRVGRPIASIGLLAPSPRVPDPAVYGPHVRALAGDVSRRLGYAGRRQRPTNQDPA